MYIYVYIYECVPYVECIFSKRRIPPPSSWGGPSREGREDSHDAHASSPPRWKRSFQAADVYFKALKTASVHILAFF